MPPVDDDDTGDPSAELTDEKDEEGAGGTLTQEEQTAGTLRIEIHFLSSLISFMIVFWL